MTIEEKNRVISGFMDLYHRGDLHYPPFGGQAVKGYALKYHSSWDWLMPVVEKIHNTADVAITIFPVVCMLEYGTKDNPLVSEFWHEKHNQTDIVVSSKIESVWRAVIQFIQWYNTQSVLNGGK